MNSNPTLPTLASSIIGELDALTITSDGYKAVVLLQGAQLIQFSTDHTSTDSDAAIDEVSNDDNWLWLSDLPEYKQGVSVRGGVPVCWPIFGQFDANPKAVRDSFADVKDMPQHGFARLRPFKLESFDAQADATSSSLTLSLTPQPDDMPKLGLQVTFTFRKSGFDIALITQNNGNDTVSFSQALHTYLPTSDITQTRISGFDNVTYSDALTIDADTGGWQTKTQQGDITFNGEVDRVYHSAPDIILNTPAQTYNLHATGSNSTVVWNPWIDKSKQISQFADDAYQRMLCIETANAHLDTVTLGAGEVWEMGMHLHCPIGTE